MIIYNNGVLFQFLGVADNEYEIESILYEERFGNKVMYLVKWKNYPMDQCTWEPYRNLTNCPNIMNEYKTNRIVPSENIYRSDKYIRLRANLNSFSDQELLELFHQVVNVGIPNIEEQFINGTIAYLTTIPASSRSDALIKFVRHNLMLIEVKRKRYLQQENLDKWQREMLQVCGFNISVFNNVDFEGPPRQFMYVNECVAGNGVTIPSDPPVWYVK